MKTFNQQFFKKPFVEKGNKVGLYGGSFNPPHKGHILVAKTAKIRLDLDYVWWMITPSNPSKHAKNLMSLDRRIEASKYLLHDPKIKITAFEEEFKNNHSAHTIAQIIKRQKGTHFVWIMGADNLKNFHLWHDWQKIVSMIAIVVIDRPKFTNAALSSVMARRYSQYRLAENYARLLPYIKPPAWIFLHNPHSYLSSSDLRQTLENKL